MLRRLPIFLLLMLLAFSPDGFAREDARTRRGKRIARLHAMLASPRGNYRGKAAEVLGKLGEAAALPKLLELVKDTDERARAGAARGLGELRSPDGIDALVGLLTDANGEVVIAAITGLGKIGHVRGTKPILDALTDDPNRWLRIAEALGRIGDKTALPALKRIFDAVKTPAEKCQVAAAIGKVNPAMGVELVHRLAKDPDPGVVFAALRAAGEMNHQAGARWLLEKTLRIDALTDGASEAVVRDAVAHAIGALRDDKLLHIFVVEAVKKRKDPKKGESADLIMVLRALALAGVPKTYGDIYPYVKDPEPDVLLAALPALGSTRDERALEPLLWGLAHTDYLVVLAAAEGLGHLGLDAAIDPLLEKLQDKDFRVRHAAAKALAMLGSEDTIEPLIRCLEESTDWLPKELASILKGLTGQELLSGAEGWRGWWEKNKSDFHVCFEEDRAP